MSDLEGGCVAQVRWQSNLNFSHQFIQVHICNGYGDARSRSLFNEGHVAPVAEITVKRQPSADATLHSVLTFLRLCKLSSSPPWWCRALAILVLCVAALKGLSSSIVCDVGWCLCWSQGTEPLLLLSWPFLLPPFHRFWSQGHLLINFVHHKLHFRAYFWRITICKNIFDATYFSITSCSWNIPSSYLLTLSGLLPSSICALLVIYWCITMLPQTQ